MRFEDRFIDLAREHLAGGGNTRSISRAIGVSRNAVRRWRRNIDAFRAVFSEFPAAVGRPRKGSIANQFPTTEAERRDRLGTCVEEGCQNPRYARWRCRDHTYTCGTPCRVPGCETPCVSLGFCRLHYMKYRSRNPSGKTLQEQAERRLVSELRSEGLDLANSHRALLFGPRETAWKRGTGTESARRCYSKTWRAIRSGKLVRPEACENCERRCKPEAAHFNYDEPLRVRWLCKRCHNAWDFAEPKGGTR